MSFLSANHPGFLNSWHNFRKPQNKTNNNYSVELQQKKLYLAFFYEWWTATKIIMASIVVTRQREHVKTLHQISLH